MGLGVSIRGIWLRFIKDLSEYLLIITRQVEAGRPIGKIAGGPGERRW